MAGGFLDLLSHLIIAVDVKDIRNKIESVLIVLNFGVEAREVETVGQILFINLTKVLVPT